MPPIFRASETWGAPAPGDTKVMHVTAGVTPITAIQITNSSGGELWLRQGSVPPRTADDSDFIVPPRATGNYPLDADQVAVKWNGHTRSVADFLAFAFTNQVVAPAVYPGVEPAKFPDSPVQSRYFEPSPNPFPVQMLTVPDGRNVGAVFVYNYSPNMVTVRVPVDQPGPLPPPETVLKVPAYSWATVPVNKEWAQLGIDPAVLRTGFLSFSWSDVDYVGPFPSGAGMLRPPNTETVSPTALYARSFNNRIDGLGSHTASLITLPASEYGYRILNAEVVLTIRPGNSLIVVTGTMQFPSTGSLFSVPLSGVAAHADPSTSAGGGTIVMRSNIAAPIPLVASGPRVAQLSLAVSGGGSGSICMLQANFHAVRMDSPFS